MKVLIVDDEDLIRDIIKEYCVASGFSCYEACDGSEALSFIKNNDVDIIILDLMMPVMNGFTCYEEIKKIKNIPTIILSARDNEIDKLNSFDMGVDDYITKPFSPKELIARIKAVLKRNSKESDIFCFDELKVDKLGHSVYICDKEIVMTPKEYDLLIYLIDNIGVAISRERLLSSVWGYDFYGDNRTIDTHVKMLRNSLGEYRDIIKTVRGVGYKLDVK